MGRGAESPTFEAIKVEALRAFGPLRPSYLTTYWNVRTNPFELVLPLEEVPLLDRCESAQLNAL